MNEWLKETIILALGSATIILIPNYIFALIIMGF